MTLCGELALDLSASRDHFWRRSAVSRPQAISTTVINPDAQRQS
jgi:hypothetical protein